MRMEKCSSINDACVLQITISDLTKMATAKVGGGGTLKADYKMLLEYLEKNFEVKNQWRVDAGIAKAESTN